MIYTDVRNKIQQLYENNKPTKFFIILKKNKEFVDIINSFYKENIKESVDVKFRTKVYMFLNNIKSFPKCEVCGNIITKDVNSIKDGFIKTCSAKCKKQLVSSKLNNFIKSLSYEDKQKINKTREQTCLQLYGKKTNLQTEDFLKKSKNTCLEKYGTDLYMKSSQFKEKSKQTIKQKYNVDNVFQAEEIKNKIIKTNIKKYGTKCAAQNSTIKEKIIKNVSLAKREKSFNIILNCKYDEPCFDIDFYKKNYSKKFLFQFKCKKCGNTFKSYQVDGNHSRCPKCFKKTSSQYESEIVDFIQSIYNGQIITNTKSIIKPLELDIYIPEKNLAIEFDGLYWHSFQNFEKTKGNKNYHLNKTEQCEKLGIQLIHIFEDEWILKQDICKSRIASLLGYYNKIVYARKCEVKEVQTQQAKDFINKNHIQGYSNSKIKIGLFLDNELVSIMTFCKSRFTNRYQWEISRFCSKLNYHVTGAGSKLLKYFIEKYNPDSIVSYADRRWSIGNLYKKLGLTFIGKSKPAYWYIKDHKIRLNRILFQKKHLKNKLGNIYNKDLSETENMVNAGYEYIYDCGNLIFSFNKK